MPHYRLQFSKQEPIRFISHLDMVKLFERAVRRGQVPIAFSQGFNPHPKMSFALPIAVGVTAQQEYIDLELREAMEPQQLADILNDNLPPGMRINKAGFKSGKEAAMALVGRAEYYTEVESALPLTWESLSCDIAGLLEQPELTVVKRTKSQEKTVDIRKGIFQLSLIGIKQLPTENHADPNGHLPEQQGDNCARDMLNADRQSIEEEGRPRAEAGCLVQMEMCLKAGNNGNIRVEDVMNALNKYLRLELDVLSALTHRKKLLTEEGGAI